jgi:hypothetical protein
MNRVSNWADGEEMTKSFINSIPFILGERTITIQMVECDSEKYLALYETIHRIWE